MLGRATETGRATFYLQSDPELVIAATGPDEPTSVTALPGNTEATVSWSAPAIDGGSPITGYRATANTGQSCTTTGALSCTITGLTNGSSYTFTAVAINARAESISSSPSAAVTPRTVPGAPTSVSATPGNSQATLSWSAPTSNGGASITGYSVTSSPAITAPADCTNTANLSCTFSGLANGTSYTFTVVALNAAGSSASSLASTAVTPRTIPGAPTDVSATPGNTQAVISWSAPTSDGGSAITGYTITSSPGANTCTTTGATSCTVTGLTNGTSYTFTVIATNVAGSSSASVASAAVTPRTIPDAPTGVSASIGNSQSIVTWQAPASNGGSAISGYSVTSSPLVSVPVGCTAINALTCTFTGLTNGTAYTFTVTAINAAGNSSASSPSSAVTPRTVPGAPTAVTTTAGNTQVIITWNAPTSDGGSAITGYSVTSSPSVTAPVGCTNVNALTCTFTGLTNGVAYTFIVTAINGAGTVAADPTAAVTPRTLPDAPTAVTAVAGNARATLSWTAPVSNGGSAITGYTVTSSPAITAPSDCTNTINLTCTFSGLTNGTVYTFTLIATNIAGSSIASASSNSVTPVTVPDAPTNVTATAGDAQIDLTWLAPTVDGGSAITGYTVVSSPAITAPVACTATTSLNCTFTGLTNGTAYTFTVIAINTVGNSLLSVASAATTPRTIPDAPTGVIATSGNAQAVITWSAPAFNGGSPITNYAVSSLPAVTPPAGCTTTTALTCVFTGLTNGTAYTFTVIATNIAGDSIASLASAPMTPAVPPTPATVTTSLTQEPEPSEPPADLQKPIEELDPIVVVVPAEPITQNEDGISILSTVGSANTMVNGRVVGEFLQIINTNQLVAQAGPIQIQIVSRNASAKAIQIPSVTQLVLEHGGKAEINGNGFKDQSSVKIWLFSTPTYLGEFPVDASGAFNAALLVINTLPVGQHTLQINGITPDNRIFSQSLPVFVKAKTTPSAKQPIKRVLPSINAVILGLTANSITFSYTEIDKASKYRIFITNVDSGRLVRAVEASRTRVVLANLIKSTRYSLIVIAYDNANKQIARMPGTGLAFTTLESNPQRPKISIICALPGRSMRVTGVNPKCPTGYSSEESFAPLGAIISKIGRN
ncbi:unannotated protein [freshwater metagenome]|uniref:Unannotated protein n=1 Tax=freshwater metagenome TaxID=449393 RepID=A0A6J6CBL7_9ZZZZ